MATDLSRIKSKLSSISYKNICWWIETRPLCGDKLS